MNTQPKLRILPVLIIVAMMAFSVRLADFALGVSSLTGGANAADTAASNEMTREQAIGVLAATEADAGEDDKMEKQDMGDDQMPKEETPEDMAEDEPPAWRDASEDEFEYSAVTREVFDDLATRRKKLDAREKELMAREAIMRAAEQELDRKFQELSNLRSQIEELLEQQSAEEIARMQSLVKIYENMKPKEAARIFDTLDLDILVGVMSRMSERKLSPIMAAMNPERARTITIMLAEEKKLPTLPESN